MIQVLSSPVFHCGFLSSACDVGSITGHFTRHFGGGSFLIESNILDSYVNLCVNLFRKSGVFFEKSGTFSTSYEVPSGRKNSGFREKTAILDKYGDEEI